MTIQSKKHESIFSYDIDLKHNEVLLNRQFHFDVDMLNLLFDYFLSINLYNDYDLNINQDDYFVMFQHQLVLYHVEQQLLIVVDRI